MGRQAKISAYFHSPGLTDTESGGNTTLASAKHRVHARPPISHLGKETASSGKEPKRGPVAEQEGPARPAKKVRAEDPPSRDEKETAEGEPVGSVSSPENGNPADPDAPPLAAPLSQVRHGARSRLSSLQKREELVLRQIEVYWPMDDAWYPAIIKGLGVVRGTHVILYDDGLEEVLNLSKETYRLVEKAAAGQKEDLPPAIGSSGSTRETTAKGGSRKRKQKAEIPNSPDWETVLPKSYEVFMQARMDRRFFRELVCEERHDQAQLQGCSVKVYWDGDFAWYPGLLESFDASTGKMNVRYEDDTSEEILLTSPSERIRFRVGDGHIFRNDEPISIGAQAEPPSRVDLDDVPEAQIPDDAVETDSPDTPDPSEGHVLPVEDDGELKAGDIVWSKVKGYPAWPCLLLQNGNRTDECKRTMLPRGCPNLPSREKPFLVQFFGTGEFLVMKECDVYPFNKGLTQKLYAKAKSAAFRKGLVALQDYLENGALQPSMGGENGDSYLSPEEFDQLFGLGTANGSPRKKKGTKGSRNGELEDDRDGFRVSQNLHILSLGSVVTSDISWHTKQYIYPLGFKAIRRYASLTNPLVTVDYVCEILPPTVKESICEPHKDGATLAAEEDDYSDFVDLDIRGKPIFRATPESGHGDVVEAASPTAVWSHIVSRVRQAKQALEGKEHDKRPGVSGPAMFGLAHPSVARLIQRLPNAECCLKFKNWADDALREKAEAYATEHQEEAAAAARAEAMKPSFEPIEVQWQHGHACAICYQEVELDQNLLVQCAACGILVHKECYGIDSDVKDGLWLCSPCTAQQKNKYEPMPYCQLCPVSGGALKRTSCGKWAHNVCAMWIPEVWFEDPVKNEPINIQGVRKARTKLKCGICGIQHGAPIQCCVEKCLHAFHPLCARAAGLKMRMFIDEDDKGSGALQLHVRAPAAQDIAELDRKASAHNLTADASHGALVQRVYCHKHVQPDPGEVCLVPALADTPFFQNAKPPPPDSATVSKALDCSAVDQHREHASNLVCARCLPFDTEKRRGRKAPDAIAAAIAKRAYLKPTPYLPTNGPRVHALASVVGREEASTLLSLAERYERMRTTLKGRLTFGKSAIHGWGVFTKKAHKAGEMLIEYCGEKIRHTVADAREHSVYNKMVGVGTYIFRLDEFHTIDATCMANFAHLINHSCEPNCASRTITVKGEDHVIISAKVPLPAGVELTYDYRFKSEDEKLVCNCGARNCRGYVNVEEETTIEAEGDGRLLSVPRHVLQPWNGSSEGGKVEASPC